MGVFHGFRSSYEGGCSYKKKIIQFPHKLTSREELKKK